jgi:4-amino-4-deoxy-L-arabinose transferase-like glycosyltransferase
MVPVMSAIALPRAESRLRLRLRAAVARPELLGLLGLAAALNLWTLGRNGWANEYYSAAVRSMSSSWHDFLYGSFDSSGVMTVDKPPLALWVQAASVKVFGFHPLSMLVPEALMGVATVALVYDLVRRRFGRAAGFAGGLALALTPITVAISRHNNPDALLILCCTAALWFVVRAFADGRTRWLVLAGVCVGLGFEAKMGVALLVVPGIAAAWLWVAPRGRVAAVRQLFAGGAAMVAVGGAWPLLVALTPAADRPWISGTSDNSIWSLITDYNGLGRLDGQAGGPQAFGGGGPFGGPVSVVRLLDSSVGGQAGWLLGFALVSGLGVLVASRLRRSDPRTGWLLAVGGAALTSAVAFSAAKGIFHPYYVSFLAPFSAALVGAGVGLLRERGLVGRAFLAAALIGGVVTEISVLRHNPGQLTWLPGMLAAAVTLSAAGLLAAGSAQMRATTVAVGVGLLLLAPASWAVQTLCHPTNGTFPAGGPSTAAAGGFGGGPGPGFAGGRSGGGGLGGPPTGGGFAGGGRGGGSVSTALVRYVQQHGGGTIAVASQMGASRSIIDSGANIAALGGFSGRESEVSVSWLADAVRTGKIRWVVADDFAAGPGRDGRVGASKVMAAVEQACTPVSSSSSLYDCRGATAALAALAR